MVSLEERSDRDEKPHTRTGFSDQALQALRSHNRLGVRGELSIGSTVNGTIMALPYNYMGMGTRGSKRNPPEWTNGWGSLVGRMVALPQLYRESNSCLLLREEVPRV